MYQYIAFLQEGAFEDLFYKTWIPWVVIPVLIVLLYLLFVRSRKREGVE